MPKQASWMLRKILATQPTWNELQQPLKAGKSIVRQIYLQLLEYNVRVPWKCMMFRNAARPKAIFTLWLHIQDRLLTKERLVAWDMDIEPKCIFCDALLETRDHLFVLKDHPGPVNWNTHLQWLIKSSKGNSQAAQVVKMVYTEGVHAIWIERNQRQFEQMSRSVEVVAKEVAVTCNIRALPGIQQLLRQYIF
ncbi:uncharacterized protein LOC132637107 [Lycium barbarum]|uniref:uncharacterized protein LOC132637107 n=1 Tax=Lycium barbarum TaxID=112863 RepID=UPI00293F74BF|nr:uncharacterized protein LOC132637107 [Lycium barbarum]